MPRDLSDVLHYFIPEPEGDESPESRLEHQAGPRPAAALPLVAVPIGDRDVVRAAFTWNLVVETARLGGRSSLVVAGERERSLLFPARGHGAAGAEVVRVGAANLEELHHAALAVAESRAAVAGEGSAVFVRIPPRWLREATIDSELLRWVLLFSSSDARDLLEAYGIAKLIWEANPRSHIGVTVHGARSLREAEASFVRLSASARRNLDRDLQRYGLIVDDLDVYRAIVAQRAIGLAHPESPAARALREVARMLAEQARRSSAS